jgi:hypothetical protein
MFSSSRISLSYYSLCLGLPMLGLGAVGCTETVSSDEIRTGGIYMGTVVTAGTSQSKVRVTLKVGGNESNTYVKLTDRDQLFALADDDEKEMTKVSDGVYEATFEVIAEDTMFEVHLEREDDEDATGNGGTLPAPFMITSDLGDGEYSRADDDIEVTWDPSDSGDDMLIEVEDDESCITATEDFDPSGDSGAYVIQAGVLGSNDEDTCELTIDVIREREGTRDGNLDEESTFFLRQIRSTVADSAP